MSFSLSDVPLWEPVKEIEVAINTMLVFCAAHSNGSRNNHYTPCFDKLHARIQGCRSNLIQKAIEIDSGEHAVLSSAYSFKLPWLDRESKARLQECLDGLRDVGLSLSRLCASNKPPRFSLEFFLRQEISTNDSEFEEPSNLFKEAENQLMLVMEDIRSRMLRQRAPGLSQRPPPPYSRGVQFNSNPQVFTSFLSPLRDRTNPVDLTELTELAKNAWYEKMVTGRVKYVNVYDENILVSEEPRDGFIKRLPSSQKRLSTLTMTPVTERRSLTLSSSAARRSTLDDRLMDSFRSGEEEADDEMKTQAQQWRDIIENRAIYHVRNGNHPSLEDAREYVENHEQHKWARRYDPKRGLQAYYNKWS